MALKLTHGFPWVATGWGLKQPILSHEWLYPLPLQSSNWTVLSEGHGKGFSGGARCRNIAMSYRAACVSPEGKNNLRSPDCLAVSSWDP